MEIDKKKKKTGVNLDVNDLVKFVREKEKTKHMI